jgi:CRISPR-associated protein Cas10/Cmr2 subtype III-B
MTNNVPALAGEVWIRKARALLLPSPFYALDPAGEPVRAERLRKYLAQCFHRCGVAVLDESEEDQKARQQAANDGYEAEVHFRAHVQQKQSASVSLKHPLSAEQQADPYVHLESGQVQEDFEKFLRELPQIDSDLSSFVRNLWFAVMTAKGVKHSLSRVPGSVLMPDHSVLAHRSLTAALHGARERDQAALLYLHVGPVQSFIQAARRTDDLWTSSFTIAFLTYIAVETVAKLVGPDALVFPDLAQLPLAQKRLFQQVVERESLTHSSLANKLLAIVPLSRAAKIAEAATTAVHAEWQAMACAAKQELTRAGKANSDLWAKWDEQISSHLDMDVVIQPWPQDKSKLSKLITDSGLELPYGPLPVDAVDRNEEDPNKQVGVFYGTLFNHSHRLMAAHRRAQTPQSAAGDSRPKCVQCVRREQMGPIAADGSKHQQQWRSRTFFTELSQALQTRNAGTTQNESTQGEGRDDRLSIQLTQGEGLCAVCLVKRLLPKVYYGSDLESKLGLDWSHRHDRRYLRFPSVYSLASAPLRYVLAAKVSGEWKSETKLPRDDINAWTERLSALCCRDGLDFTHPGNLLPGFRKRAERWGKHLDGLLDVDGSWLYRERYVFDTAWRDHYPDKVPSPEERTKVSGLLQQGSKSLGPILDVAGCQPSPYLAILCADVDRMGEWLTGVKAPTWGKIATDVTLPSELTDKKRPLYPALGADLSRRLGKLATETFLEIVEQECLGRVVYGGGDDLLAFLPLQTALHCMNRLHQTVRSVEHLGSEVTLSVGLHIMHCRDPLTRAIDSARKAEGQAKDQGRNRFTISLGKRSGAPILFTLPWQLGMQARSTNLPANTIELVLSLLNKSFRKKKENTDTDLADTADEQETKSTQAAYELEQELLPLLEGSADSPPSKLVLDALFDRTRVLCGFPRDQPWIGEAFLWNGILNKDTQSEAVLRQRSENLKRFVDVLLLVRFLQREEHGLQTSLLLDKLKQEKAL